MSPSTREKIISHLKFAQKFEFVVPDSLFGIGKKLGPREKYKNLNQKRTKIFDGKDRKMESI